jgi:hypothetical protein
MYTESNQNSIDVRGGSGYLVVDNQMKYELSAAASTAYTHYLSNFTGFLGLFNLGYSLSLFSLDMPSAGSSTAIFGVQSQIDIDPIDYCLSSYLITCTQNATNIGQYAAYQSVFGPALPAQFQQSSTLACDPLYGLTSAQTQSPENLSVGGSSYLLRYLPASSTTLAGDITATQTTLTVADMSQFGWLNHSGQHITVQVDSEQMTIVGNPPPGGSTWTVSRGVNGTMAAAHASGATVQWASGNREGMVCQDIPESAAPFTMPAQAIDALRYRPFPEPSAPSAGQTAIVLHRVEVNSNRQFAVTVNNLPTN